MTRCCVPKCSEIGVHHFPTDSKIRKLWLKAIRRVKFTIKQSSRLCVKHFVESDYEEISKHTGLVHQHKYLKKIAVPSVFPWTEKPLSLQAKARQERYQAREIRKSLFHKPSTSKSEDDVLPLDAEVDTQDISHVIEVPSEVSTVAETLYKTTNSQGTQTPNILRIFGTELLQSDEVSVNYYTGLENYQKLTLVLSTLLPMAYSLKYRWSQVVGLSIEDQFMMLLMKLRRNIPDFELSRMFGVSKTEVSNLL